MHLITRIFQFQVTVVNEVLLKSLYSFHGETNFALAQTPKVISSTMISISSLYGGDTSDTVRLFGLLKENILDQQRDQLHYPEGFNNLGFGNWIYEGDIFYKEQIRSHRSSRDFNVVEMNGLMDALSNENLLGATKKILSNASFPEKCIMPSADFTKGFSLGSNQEHTFSDNIETCRLTSCLYQFKNLTANQLWTPDLTETINCIAMYLCTNVNQSCLLFPQENDSRLAYAHAVHDYIFHQLVHYVFHVTVILVQDDLIVRKNQRSLALGYYLNETSTFHLHDSNFVPGILEHADSIKNDTWYLRRKKILLYDCYDTVEAETNFMWKGWYLKICMKYLPIFPF